nr:hypothetical protein [Acinetobacter sp. Marseille-Q1620]
MKDLNIIRELFEKLTQQKTKNSFVYLVGMVDISNEDIQWLIQEQYVEVDEAISYLDNKDIIFIKQLTEKGNALFSQLRT